MTQGKFPAQCQHKVGPKSVLLEPRYSGDTGGEGGGVGEVETVSRRPVDYQAYLSKARGKVHTPPHPQQPVSSPSTYGHGPLGEGRQVRTGT